MSEDSQEQLAQLAALAQHLTAIVERVAERHAAGTLTVAEAQEAGRDIVSLAGELTRLGVILARQSGDQGELR